MATSEEKIDALKDRVVKLETYFHVTVALLAIFGLTGGFVVKSMWSAKAQLDKTMADATNLDQRMKSVTADLQSQVDKSTQTIQAKADEYVKNAGREQLLVLRGEIDERMNYQEEQTRFAIRWLDKIYNSALGVTARPRGDNSETWFRLIADNGRNFSEENWAIALKSRAWKTDKQVEADKVERKKAARIAATQPDLAGE